VGFGTRLVRGRALTATDGASAQRVAVVNERFVELFLEGREPLGQRVTMDGLVPGRQVSTSGVSRKSDRMSATKLKAIVMAPIIRIPRNVLREVLTTRL